MRELLFVSNHRGNSDVDKKKKKKKKKKLNADEILNVSIIFLMLYLFSVNWNL